MFEISGTKIQTPEGHLLAITVDTLISGVHFPINTSPEDVGHKALAVNLSDLAAMGALPKWIALTIVMTEGVKPEKKASWLEGFEKGLMVLANDYEVQLISTDTYAGPLAITINAIGVVEEGMGLLRSGAQLNDRIYVTGTLGDAGAALKYNLVNNSLPDQYQSYLLDQLNRPMPRINAGLALKEIANSAIDISDGLVADLGHICKASNVGAAVFTYKLPVSDALLAVTNKEDALQLGLTAGDDYELCFTVPEEKKNQLEEIFEKLDVSYTYIGNIIAEPGLHLLDENRNEVKVEREGYQHF